MVKIVGYSHLWIALGAMCSAMATLHASTSVHEWSEAQWGIASIIGIGTGAVYTLQRRIKWLRMPNNIPEERREFIANWSGLILGIWGLAALIWARVFWSWLLNWAGVLSTFWPLLLALAMCSLGYASNPFSKHSTGWRDVSRMKLPVIALSWGLATVWIPSVMSGAYGWETTLVMRSIAQSLFIAGLTIPFDVRDVSIDPKSMKTIPQSFGHTNALKIALSLFVISALLFCWIDKGEAPLIAMGCALPWVIYGRFHRSEWLYSLILDGCLIVQGFVIFFL
ncbi:MAG: hypothetical protein CL834_02065 [Crocinitomicaceae bacterium]|nr:hypothetical protein [Crocinitomicaceae bacterium]|tara:strand:+ start:548 stop:1390 length:843 start_codon:yes stop_codon:yes gene_type:complete